MTKHYDLVIIGAGIAGLNALHAASVYLSNDARVLLVDAKEAAGGMWNTTYDYVRMHQPHPFFTAGNIAWNWRKPRDYLATGPEVQQHLNYCLDQLRNKVQLDTRFGHLASNPREVQYNGVWMAKVDLRPVGARNDAETVISHKIVDAAGYNVSPVAPLTLTSGDILSVTPETLNTTLGSNPDVPAYVVGGGKTGMDTVLEIQRKDPNRQITLINGQGTYYISRDVVFPSGLKRWFGGKLSGEMIHRCATKFDGDNEADMRSDFIETYASGQDAKSLNHIWGILSEAENRKVNAALADKMWDYLEDVTDGADSPQMTLRSGTQVTLPKGSIFVNCTGGFVGRNTDAPWRPCLSPHDAILSINTRQAMHILTTISSFFLSHLFFSGGLRHAGLFFLDLEALVTKDKQTFTAATFSQSLHNFLMGLRALPPEARGHFGLDANNWYPLPRKLLALNAIRKTAREDVKHCRVALNRVVERFDIQGGFLADGK